MNFSQRYVELLSNRRIIVPAVLVTAMTAAYLSSLEARLSTGQVNIMDMQFSFSAEQFKSSLIQWPDQKVLLYIQYLQIDLLFSLICALTLSSVMGAMWKHLLSLCGENFPQKVLSRSFPFLFLLPYLAATAGLIEDLLLYSAVRIGMKGSGIIIGISILASVRYSFFALSITGIMGLLIARRRKMKHR